MIGTALIINYIYHETGLNIMPN